MKCEEVVSLERKHLHLQRKMLKMSSNSNDSTRNEDRLALEIEKLWSEIDRMRVACVSTQFNNEVPRTVNAFQPLISPSGSKGLAVDEQSASKLRCSSIDESLSRTIFPWRGCK